MGVGEEKHGYRLGEILGRNVHGGRLTYAATRLDDDRDVIIKQFSFAREDADWAGFKAHQRELETLKSLNHPSIPSFLDAFQVEDGFWLVQERVHAQPLSHRRRWEFEQVEQIARDLLDLLVYLQDLNPPIIHRDLKPENILRHESGEVHLIDFGLARDAQRDGSSSTVAAGTPGFMAPEQFFNTGVDERTDLYGLGATLYALLAGIGTEDMRLHVSTSFVLNFDKLPRKTPAAFRSWLEVMTRPEKDDRFEDARSAREALDSALSPPEPSRPAASSSKAERSSPHVSPGEDEDLAVLKSSSATMPEQRKSDSSERPSWEPTLILCAIAAVVLAALSLPTLWRIPANKAPSFLKPLVLRAHALRMSEEGGAHRCTSWVSLDLKAGEHGAPKRYESVYATDGCRLRLEGFAIGSLSVREGAEVELVDVTLDSINQSDARLTLRGGSFHNLNVGKESSVHISNAQGGKVYISGATNLEGNDLELEGLHANDNAFARLERVRISESLYVSERTRVIAETIKLGRSLVVGEEGLLLLRDPLLSQPLPRDRNILILKPGEDTDKRYAEFLEEAKTATRKRLDRKALEQALRESAQEIRTGGCNEVGDCVQEQKGKQEARIQVESGKATLLEGPPCIEKALSKLEPHRQLSGTLTCKYNIYEQNGAVVFNVNGHFEEKR